MGKNAAIRVLSAGINLYMAAVAAVAASHYFKAIKAEGGWVKMPRGTAGFMFASLATFAAFVALGVVLMLFFPHDMAAGAAYLR